MSVYGINLDLFSSSPIVILKVEDENRYLPIWIGQPEARSILMKLQNQEFSRPLTHDLAVNLVTELGGTLERVTVTALRTRPSLRPCTWRWTAAPSRLTLGPRTPSRSLFAPGPPSLPPTWYSKKPR